MKKLVLASLLVLGGQLYSNEFVNTNKQEDLTEIGNLINNAFEVLCKVASKELLEKPAIKENIDAISAILKDSDRLQKLINGKLNENEIKSVVILLKKVSTIKELQYLPMMLTVLVHKAKSLLAENKDLINAALKYNISLSSNILENLNKSKSGE